MCSSDLINVLDPIVEMAVWLGKDGGRRRLSGEAVKYSCKG